MTSDISTIWLYVFRCLVTTMTILKLFIPNVVFRQLFYNYCVIHLAIRSLYIILRWISNIISIISYGILNIMSENRNAERKVLHLKHNWVSDEREREKGTKKSKCTHVLSFVSVVHVLFIFTVVHPSNASNCIEMCTRTDFIAEIKRCQPQLSTSKADENAIL